MFENVSSPTRQMSHQRKRQYGKESSSITKKKKQSTLYHEILFFFLGSIAFRLFLDAGGIP
jgi:hypothetical protein